MFLIEFEDPWDKSRVLEGRLWDFEGSLFAVEDFDGMTPPGEIEFDKVSLWVRMINIPLVCMCKEVGLQISAFLGTVEEVDTDEDGVRWGEYLRVRVKIDPMKPLSRGRTLMVQGKSVRVFFFQYEGLPRFCFQCGCISRGKEGCLFVRSLQNREGGPQLGPWLRAESSFHRREKERRRQEGWRENRFQHMKGGWYLRGSTSRDVFGNRRQTGDDVQSSGDENRQGVSGKFRGDKDVTGEGDKEGSSGMKGGFSGEIHVHTESPLNDMSTEKEKNYEGIHNIKKAAGGGSLEGKQTEKVRLMEHRMISFKILLILGQLKIVKVIFMGYPQIQRRHELWVQGIL